jgi:hypothetical protein
MKLTAFSHPAVLMNKSGPDFVFGGEAILMFCAINLSVLVPDFPLSLIYIKRRN